jgi:hypothetical protein
MVDLRYVVRIGNMDLLRRPAPFSSPGISAVAPFPKGLANEGSPAAPDLDGAR